MIACKVGSCAGKGRVTETEQGNETCVRSSEDEQGQFPKANAVRHPVLKSVAKPPRTGWHSCTIHPRRSEDRLDA